MEEIGNERISTELGLLNTLKVRRLRAGSRRETILWCAEELGYLPVRITHREPDGTTLELRIRTATGL